MSSYTAAGVAGSDLWSTSIDAIRMGASGYFLPFLFALNPALILYGSATEIVYAVSTVVLSGAYLSWAAEGSIGVIRLTRVERIGALLLAAAIGTATLWLGSDSVFNVAILAVGGGLIPLFRRVASRGQVTA
jgi:TRAP-type uncharacterized transport system fused permease subunit